MLRKSTIGLTLCIALLLPLPLAAAKAKVEKDELYEELDFFAKALSFVRDNYVVAPNDKELVYGAIEGMLQSLDPHSVFMPPDVYKELQLDTTGRFGGVGIEVTVRDGLLTVIAPIEGSPASSADIRPGDRILQINGKTTKRMSLSDAVNLMRGRRGSKVTLQIGRNGHAPFNVALRRDVIHVQSVRSVERLGDGLAYIRISAFQQDTSDALEEALNKLEQSPEGLKGLIIDLRNNPGGLLTEAVDVSDKFLSKGVIVSTKSRTEPEVTQRAEKEGTHKDYPIVLLVNGGSASAAEIVAGALQDNKRAILVGEQTFGKGSVQTVFDMGNGAALKLTVARYYTPNGRSIQSEGIRPDIIVAPKIHEQEVRVSKDMSGKGKAKPEEEESFSVSVEEDVQKEAAINYLRKEVGLKKAS